MKVCFAIGGSSRVFVHEYAGSSRVPFWAYTDPQLYQRELEKIFYGAHWCYVGLEAEVPRPGDFKRTVVGGRSVEEGVEDVDRAARVRTAELLAEGVRPSAVARRVAAEYGIPRNRAYELALGAHGAGEPAPEDGAGPGGGDGGPE